MRNWIWISTDLKCRIRIRIETSRTGTEIGKVDSLCQLIIKGTQAWDNFDFFLLPKSKPYMPLVNFQNFLDSFPSIFAKNFDVRTFSRWLSICGNKFFWWAIKNFFPQNFHFGPIRWIPRRFFKISIVYSQNLRFYLVFLNNFRKL